MSGNLQAVLGVMLETVLEKISTIPNRVNSSILQEFFTSS
jgi:hypothetical protein